MTTHLLITVTGN